MGRLGMIRRRAGVVLLMRVLVWERVKLMKAVRQYEVHEHKKEKKMQRKD